MKIENTTGQLRALSDRLFSLIEELSGERPHLVGNTEWYRAQSTDGPFVYLRLVGERARTLPPNAVHLATKWDDSLANTQVVPGNNWYGERSADLVVQAAKADDIGPAEAFIRTAFRLYGKRSSC